MEKTAAASEEEAARLARVLADADGWFVRHRRWLLPILALLVLSGTAVAWYLYQRQETAPRYRTEAAVVRTLVVTVSATGGLKPTNQVDVGSEMSGIVEKVFVDDNDRVKKGQLVAQLDLSRLQDNVARSRAAVAAAQAQVAQARATVAETRANLSRFQQLYSLSKGTVPSKSDLDTVEASFKRANASEDAALATVAQAQAVLKSDTTSLEKAHIRSPIDGVVLVRKVEPGQTVAASFQAPVLFTIAQDLSKMELQVDIDEADVGQIQAGQAASFVVDAWPGRTFKAEITRVGYGSNLKDGVVSYPAQLKVENDDLSLRPGMTGTAQITTLTRQNALLVPNAALRFAPAEATPATAARSRNLIGALLPRIPMSRPRATQTTHAGPAQRTVWVLRDGVAVAVPVQVGATDGRMTEILGGELRAGMEVITETVATPP